MNGNEVIDKTVTKVKRIVTADTLRNVKEFNECVLIYFRNYEGNENNEKAYYVYHGVIYYNNGEFCFFDKNKDGTVFYKKKCVIPQAVMDIIVKLQLFA